jgi:hypothetical protein
MRASAFVTLRDVWLHADYFVWQYQGAEKSIGHSRKRGAKNCIKKRHARNLPSRKGQVQTEFPGKDEGDEHQAQDR